MNVDYRNPIYTTLDGALYSKDKKSIIAYPSGMNGLYTIPSQVTGIGKYAFCESSLATIYLPAGIQIIADYAFGKNLKKIRFTGSVPPSILGANVFSEITRNDSFIIEVPEASLSQYIHTIGNIDASLVRHIVGYN